MKKKAPVRIKYFLGIPLLFIMILFGLYVAFEYTLVADLRESFSTVDESDPLAMGKTLFETRGCNGCHSIIKGEENLGPNLNGIASRETEEYIRESIEYPNRVVVEGFSDKLMPDYGKILGSDQVEALVKYLLSLK